MEPQYTLTYTNPLRTFSTHVKSGIEIITDAPVDNFGKGESFSPTDLLATSLVSCVMTIVGIACSKSDTEILSMNASVNKIMASKPRRVAEIRAHIRISLIGCDLNEAKRLERVARACPVAKSLSDEVLQNLTFEFDLQKG
ncbi:MAG: osmotically inducible protein OsmC [Bacteroidetes bacterium]|nr:MAG: osmotically inducible protein OsmC [Bacteroidota bacterium]